VEADQQLVERIRRKEPGAWNDLIALYEGRLQAYINPRLTNRSAVEDIVQETFIGFLNSLPNYDGRRLQSYLFRISSNKLADHLRREGRRPTISLATVNSDHSDWNLASHERAASSIVRSDERRTIEEHALRDALTKQVEYWREREDWLKIQCLELIIVRGWSNKQTAEKLGVSQQKVASVKHEFVNALARSVRSRGLPEEVFPELYETGPPSGMERDDP
jgi:RNA polymerase sigma-70 factor (ECF subfamily)